jgi:PLP dependent protein
MCIPTLDEERATHFCATRQDRRATRREVAHIGTSGDFARAIQFGATYVRIGTAIFGARPNGQW